MDKRTEFLTCHWQPFPAADRDWQTVTEFANGQDSTRFVCGRVVRVSGSWQLRSDGVQLGCQFEMSAVWRLDQNRTLAFDLDVLRSGDLVALKLTPFQIKQPQLVTEVQLLVPSEGFYQGNLDFTHERAQAWTRFLALIRSFFQNRGFFEALTPALVPSPGTEPFLDPFVTTWEYGSERRPVFLPTSPEFHLKKLLVSGWTRVFEFKTCFRNGEIGPHHQPEFQMLEWYRAFANLEHIADDVEALLGHLAESFSLTVPPLQRTTMNALFHQHFRGFELTPFTSLEELQKLAGENQIACNSSDSWDDVFFRLFLEKIEARLGANGPLLVRGYPPSQAALARLGEDGFADRFEIYWRGFELGNAFHELNDARENERRFGQDAQKKAELGKSPVPVDEELLTALRYGLPPSGGIAMGLERIFMALLDLKSITECRAFPVIS